MMTRNEGPKLKKLTLLETRWHGKENTAEPKAPKGGPCKKKKSQTLHRQSSSGARQERHKKQKYQEEKKIRGKMDRGL